MLKIKAPLKTVCNTNIAGSYDGFNERIAANYGMLNVNLTPEDFLHFVTQPPEIYLGEEGMTTIVDSVNMYQNNSSKLDIVNNVINRITLYDESTLTYQDKVFISNVLRKLGIKDVQVFMNQVRNLKNEATNSEELINLYWEHSDEIRELKERILKEDETTVIEKGEDEEAAVNNYLYENIMKRLKTAAVYQEISNFVTENTRNTSNVSNAELKISEQTNIAKNVLLNYLQNNTFEESEPLNYQNINAYEYRSGDINNMSDTQIRNQLVEAAVLSVINQVYTTRLSEITSKNDIWLNIKNAFLDAADNTFERFEYNHLESFAESEEVLEYIEKNQITNNEEINQVKKVVESANQYSRNTNISNTNFEGADYTFRTDITSEEDTEITEGDTIRKLYQSEKNELNQLKKIFTEKNQSFTNISNQARSSSNKVNINQNNINAGDVNSENITLKTEDNTSVSEFTQNNEERISNTERNISVNLNKINENNIRNQQKIEQIMNGLSPEKPKAVNINRTKQEGLLAITNPEAAIMKFNETVENSRETSVFDSEVMKESLSEETIQIFKQLENYRKGKNQVDTLVKNNAFAQFYRDINMVERETKTIERELVPRIEETVEESIRNTVTREQRGRDDKVQYKEITDRVVDQVALLHKVEETVVDEEMIESARNINRSINKENVVRETKTNTEVISESTVNEIKKELKENNLNEIDRIVSEKVRRQINGLSDVVYQKLERKLGNERMRRGR